MLVIHRKARDYRLAEDSADHEESFVVDLTVGTNYGIHIGQVYVE